MFSHNGFEVSTCTHNFTPLVESGVELTRGSIFHYLNSRIICIQDISVGNMETEFKSPNTNLKVKKRYIYIFIQT